MYHIPVLSCGGEAEWHRVNRSRSSGSMSVCKSVCVSGNHTGVVLQREGAAPCVHTHPCESRIINIRRPISTHRQTLLHTLTHSLTQTRTHTYTHARSLTHHTQCTHSTHTLRSCWAPKSRSTRSTWVTQCLSWSYEQKKSSLHLHTHIRTHTYTHAWSARVGQWVSDVVSTQGNTRVKVHVTATRYSLASLWVAMTVSVSVSVADIISSTGGAWDWCNTVTYSLTHLLGHSLHPIQSCPHSTPLSPLHVCTREVSKSVHSSQSPITHSLTHSLIQAKQTKSNEEVNSQQPKRNQRQILKKHNKKSQSP
jgi:hypothetical protein